jgi:hypothetical protein
MPRRVVVAASAMLLCLTAGCGGGKNTPLEATPELEAALTRVDDAIINETYQQARVAARDLKQLAIAAKASGDLTNNQADEIVAAAVQLVADLPRSTRPEPTEDLTPSPTPTTEASTEPEKTEKEDKGKPPKEEDSPGNSDNAPGHEDG